MIVLNIGSQLDRQTRHPKSAQSRPFYLPGRLEITRKEPQDQPIKTPCPDPELHEISSELVCLDPVGHIAPHHHCGPTETPPEAMMSGSHRYPAYAGPSEPYQARLPPPIPLYQRARLNKKSGGLSTPPNDVWWSRPVKRPEKRQSIDTTTNRPVYTLFNLHHLNWDRSVIGPAGTAGNRLQPHIAKRPEHRTAYNDMGAEEASRSTACTRCYHPDGCFIVRPTHLQNLLQDSVWKGKLLDLCAARLNTRNPADVSSLCFEYIAFQISGFQHVETFHLPNMAVNHPGFLRQAMPQLTLPGPPSSSDFNSSTNTTISFMNLWADVMQLLDPTNTSQWTEIITRVKVRAEAIVQKTIITTSQVKDQAAEQIANFAKQRISPDGQMPPPIYWVALASVILWLALLVRSRFASTPGKIDRFVMDCMLTWIRTFIICLIVNHFFRQYC